MSSIAIDKVVKRAYKQVEIDDEESYINNFL